MYTPQILLYNVYSWRVILCKLDTFLPIIKCEGCFGVVTERETISIEVIMLEIAPILSKLLLDMFVKYVR